jgi:preprotein translocase subunit SecE
MNLAEYFRESLEELRRVTWPSREEVVNGTQTVLLFVVLFATALWVADIVFHALSIQVFGGR